MGCEHIGLYDAIIKSKPIEECAVGGHNPPCLRCPDCGEWCKLMTESRPAPAEPHGKWLAEALRAKPAVAPCDAVQVLREFAYHRNPIGEKYIDSCPEELQMKVIAVLSEADARPPHKEDSKPAAPEGIDEVSVLKMMLEQYEKQGSYSQAEALKFALAACESARPGRGETKDPFIGANSFDDVETNIHKQVCSERPEVVLTSKEEIEAHLSKHEYINVRLEDWDDLIINRDDLRDLLRRLLHYHKSCSKMWPSVYSNNPDVSSNILVQCEKELHEF